MTCQHFTHLHLHTDYSLLDGAISLDKLIAYGKAEGRRALAISDHGNIFGAVKFFEKCKKAGIKPILGMEAYITPSIEVKNIHNRYYHLLILVKNKTGYKNLCRLIAASYTKGFYYKPRIDYQLLKEHHEGLIITSTCLGGHIPQLLLQHQQDEAKALVTDLASVFKDRYFLEVQPPWTEEQATVNAGIFELEKTLGIPVLATGDCHYATKEDRYAHEVMLAVQTRTTMEDLQRMTFGDYQAHMHSIAELQSFFPEREDILWQSGKIADSCEFMFETGKLFFPKYEIADKAIDTDHFFKTSAEKGFEKLVFEKRIPEHLLDIYTKRLDEEIAMINTMGFSTYFLIVSDLISWAKQHGIAVGPGRGSVAGSLVSWALSITDIDPIKYNLLFERFLNPERVSMPDIDIDFCIHGREKVIQYVKDKYGHDKVGQIITFGTMLSKGVVKDVARALGIPFEEANMISGLIPDELKITLEEAITQEPKLKQLIDSNRKIAELFDIAFRLEGLTRHASKHAAGIVISPEPIAEVLPIYVPTKSTDIVTQYAMTELELLGFLKMDFLGLKNLTLITNLVEVIEKHHGIRLHISDLPLDDTKTFALLQQGETSGVFQLESNGIKDVLRRLKPNCFEDIIAVNALYRPGPLGSGMVDDFILRKQGKQAITYTFPELEEILKETYGVIVYQEQVMKIATAIAGYSLGESDILRRAMGKKKPEEMAKQKEIFVSRSISRGFDGKKADELFELMAYFAGYGFNKSHSAAYALIAYQTAYLKAHFPVEFMAGLITLELSHPETTLSYLKEVKKSSITLLSPDINHSQAIFTGEKNHIRWGLLGIKNVGSIAVEDIIKERNKEQFKDLLDFCMRVDLRTSNKRVIESLIASGAFDSFPHSRSQMIGNLDITMEYAQRTKESERSGQLSLFESDIEEEKKKSIEEQIKWTTFDEWTMNQLLESEKEVLGLYMSRYPLDTYKPIETIIGCTTIEETPKIEHALTRGTLAQIKEITTKKGELMAFATIEDETSKAEIIFFPRVYQTYKETLRKNETILIQGDARESDDSLLKIKARTAYLFDTFSCEKDIKQIIFHINHTHDENDISLLKTTLEQAKPGKDSCCIEIADNQRTYEHTLDKTIAITKEFLEKTAEKKFNQKVLLK
jgi:DNA polymerase-3 subunit alpha